MIKDKNINDKIIFNKDQQQKNNTYNNNSQQKAKMIIEKCIQQNIQFKRWSSQKQWRIFHYKHYDWWAFPYNERSSYGTLYKIGPQQIQIMNKKQDFINVLRQNAILVCQAWGYDLRSGQLIPTQDQNQTWQQHAIRLYKMSKSLQIFKIQKQFQNSIKYGIILLQKKYTLTYGRKNFTNYYQKEWQQIKIRDKLKTNKNQIKIDKK